MGTVDSVLYLVASTVGRNVEMKEQMNVNNPILYNKAAIRNVLWMLGMLLSVERQPKTVGSK